VDLAVTLLLKATLKTPLMMMMMMMINCDLSMARLSF